MNAVPEKIHAGELILEKSQALHSLNRHRKDSYTIVVTKQFAKTAISFLQYIYIIIKPSSDLRDSKFIKTFSVG